MSERRLYWGGFWNKVSRIPAVVPKNIAEEIGGIGGDPNSHFTIQTSNGKNVIIWTDDRGNSEFYAFFPSPEESPPRA